MADLHYSNSLDGTMLSREWITREGTPIDAAVADACDRCHRRDDGECWWHQEDRTIDAWSWIQRATDQLGLECNVVLYRANCKKAWKHRPAPTRLLKLVKVLQMLWARERFKTDPAAVIHGASADDAADMAKAVDGIVHVLMRLEPQWNNRMRVDDNTTAMRVPWILTHPTDVISMATNLDQETLRLAIRKHLVMDF